MRVISRTSFRVIGVFVATIAVLAFALISDVNKKNTLSAIDPVCTPVVNIGLSNGSTATSLNGVVNLVVGSTSTNLQINKVIIMANNQPVGQAQPVNTYSWSMPWVTSLFPNGPAGLSATIYSSNTTAPCTTPTLTVNVQNPTTTTNNLETSINPPTWQGPISFSFPINANLAVTGTSFNPTPYALFKWTAGIGNISPQGNIAQFSSGQTVGTGAVNVEIRYSGAVISRNIPISVMAPNTPLPDATTTNTTSNTTTTGGNTTTPTPNSAKNHPLQNNPVAQNCAISAIGQARYDAINNAKERPTPDEMNKLNICFAANNYILPSNFAPVAPTTIKELKSNDNFKVAKLENVDKQNDNGTQKVLKITGQATSKSLVLIYIFSDPLVLTTTADDTGNWTYTLEDPIESGNHEVYSVVDRGDGVYERSNPFSFIIGTATAAESNPNGLSLQLAETATPAQSQRGMMSYIIGSVVLLIVVLVGFIVIMRVRTKKHVAQPVIAQENLAPPVEPTTISPITTEPPTPMEDKPVNEKSSPETLHTDEPESDPVPAETTTVEEATKTQLSEEVELTPEVDDPNQNNPSI